MLLFSHESQNELDVFLFSFYEKTSFMVREPKKFYYFQEHMSFVFGDGVFLCSADFPQGKCLICVKTKIVLKHYLPWIVFLFVPGCNWTRNALAYVRNSIMSSEFRKCKQKDVIYTAICPQQIIPWMTEFMFEAFLCTFFVAAPFIANFLAFELLITTNVLLKI